MEGTPVHDSSSTLVTPMLPTMPAGWPWVPMAGWAATMTPLDKTSPFLGAHGGVMAIEEATPTLWTPSPREGGKLTPLNTTQRKGTVPGRP